MRCAILGGAGFLGRHIGRSMSAEGMEVWSIDRTPPQSEAAPWLAGEVQADCFDLSSWWDVVGGADVIVHLASSTVPATASEDPVQDAQTNLVGTLRLLQALRQQQRDWQLVGIHTGGVWLAQRLAQDLQLKPPGALDISFYRDDFSRIGLHPQLRPSAIPFELEGASILLIDDVLFTGRTLRAAMNALFDYGRPARIDLAVLVDRQTGDADRDQ